MMNTYIGLIPARGGSKGIPRKNLAVVGTQSLLQRAVACALGSRKVSVCYVWSDDEEILSKSAAYGAIPLFRQEDASGDAAEARDVVLDFLAKQHDTDPLAKIVYLQPTSPFRNWSHVDRAIDEMESAGTELLVSVTHSYQLPGKGLSIDASGQLGARMPSIRECGGVAQLVRAHGS